MSRIVYGDVCVRCECAIDDDGVLYCSEDVCIKGETSDVNEPGIQQAATS